MLTTDEDALVCDLAETYHVFDYRSMSVQLVAALAAGLSDDSRVKRKIAGMPIALNTLLLARAVDHLAFLAWAKTKDAESGRNHPKSVVSLLMGREPESGDYEVFDSAEAFEAARKQILEKGGE